MSLPVFSYVYYLSPWAPLPPGFPYQGVYAYVTAAAGQTAGPYTAGRLRQGNTTIQTVISNDKNSVLITPAAPLSAMLDYYLDVQWVASSTTQPSWNAGSYVTAPLITAIATALEGSISGLNLTLAWTFGAAALVPSGASLNAYAGASGAGSITLPGTSGTLALKTTATAGSLLYIQPIMPITASAGTAFAPPFTMGPVIAPLALPIGTPTITSVAYEGGRIQVGWTAPAAPAGSAAISYALVVTSGSGTSYVAAGPGGGMAVIDSGVAGTNAVSVSGRTQIGPLIGAPGAATALITAVPVVGSVAVAGSTVTAAISFPASLPTGATAAVRLLQNGRSAGTATVGSTGGIATLAGFTGGDGWSVQAQMTATVSGATVAGPWSDPVPVLVAAPAIRNIDMRANPAAANSWLVTVEAAAPPPAGSALTIALTQNATAVASQTVANGNSAGFTLTQGATAAANTINGASVATASMTIAGPHGTSPAAQASFVGAAPVIGSVQNFAAGDPTGASQGVVATLAQVPSASQIPTLRLLADGVVFATANGAASNATIILPLAQPLNPAIAWTVQARLTGNGVTADTFGGWSAPVAVLTATTSLVSADFDAGQLTLATQPPQGVSPAGSAYLFAFASGQATKGATVTGTRASFALPAPAAAWSAAARPAQLLSGGGGSFAPSSAAVALLLAAPTLASISYDGATLSAAWSVVTDVAGNPATGALLRIAGAGGTLSTSVAGSGAGSVALPIPASAQGTVTVAIRATRTSAAAALSGAYCTAVPPIVAAPTLGTVTANAAGTVLTAALALPTGMPSGVIYRAWLMAADQILAGPVDATVSGQTGTVSFPYSAPGVAGLSIMARAQATVNGVALTGPASPSVPVLAVAPQLALVTIATDPGDTTKWSLTGDWRAPSDGASIASYSLKLTDPSGGSAGEGSYGGDTSGAFSFAKSSVSATLAYTLTLTSTSPNGSTTPPATAPVSFATPLFTAVAMGDTQVSAAWATASAPAGLVYRLSLIDAASGAAIAVIETAATTATLEVGGLHLLSGGSYQLGLATRLGVITFDPGSDGSYRTRPVLLLAAPGNLTVATDAKTGLATLGWEAVPGASGYTVQFSDGRVAAAVTDTSYTFSSAVPLGSTVSVTANVTADTVVSTGPASTPLTMPAIAPALTSADYNGVTARAAWQAVAGAVGYSATVLDKDGNVAATAPQTGATGTSFAVSLASAAAPFTLQVQALTATGSGPRSNRLPLFQTGWFVSTTATSTAPPHVFPSSTMALAPEQITLYLPALGAAAVSIDPVGPFALAYLGNPDATFPYTLTFAATSDVWTFSNGDSDPLPTIRPQLQADYVTFLKAAQNGGASPWGISVLQQAIARWMPQTFDELHYYSYGLYLTGGNGTGAIDLRQGLVLRVGFADYTNVWSGDTNSWLNGFGGGSSNDFDVADFISGANEWQLSMDAFVARLTSSGAMNVSPPATLISASAAAGVADAADLFFPTFPNPFYRLFFPGTLQNPTSTGSVSTPANFALASAPNYAALTTASPSAGQSGNVAYFRGRAVLRLMIRVRVNDMELVVPLGTTVGNILDRYMVRPPATSVQLTGVVLERAAGPGVAVFGASPAAPPAVYDAAARHAVRLDWSTMATYGGPVDATNLPLIHGDRIAF